MLGVIVRLVLPSSRARLESARRSVYLARAPEVAGITGSYFVKGKVAKPSPMAQDKGAVARLWELSAELAGVDPPVTVAGASRSGSYRLWPPSRENPMAMTQPADLA